MIQSTRIVPAKIIWPSGNLLAENLPALLQLNPEELRLVRYQIAQSLHGELVQKSDCGLVISETPCIGKISDALASNNGSSAYLKGSFSGSIFRPANDLNSVVGIVSENLIADLCLSGVKYLVAITCEADRGRSCVYDYSKQAFFSEIDFALSGDSLVNQETLAIAGLISLAHRVCDSESLSRINSRIKSAIVSPSVEMQTALARPTEIRQASKLAWLQLQEVINSLPQILVGESFTLGKLAELISFSAGGSSPDISYGWYSPAFKQAVGVPNMLLSDKEIAEPITVNLAARRLLEYFSMPQALAFATSGWANYSVPGQADFFSIALSTQKQPTGFYSLRRCTVLATANSPLGLSRREITRELGVAVAISMFLGYAQWEEPKKKPEIEKIAAPLNAIIRGYLEYN